MKMETSIRPVFSFFKRYKALAILTVLLIFMAFVKPLFFRPAYLRDVLLKVSIQGVIGFGMTFALVAGEFDMSVGSILTLSGILFATLLQTMSFISAVFLTLLAGIVMGLANGTLVSRLRVNSFIATLGAQYVYKAVALMISAGNPIKVVNPVAVTLSNFRLGGNTIFPLVFFLVGILSAYILKRTRIGRNIYATGGNYDVAKNTGINVQFYKTLVFVIVCCASALAGILMTIRMQSATTIAGDDTSLTVISSVIIGGTSPAGGIGGAFESFIGLIIIAVVTSSLDLLGISGYYKQVAQGFLTVAIIGAISYSNYRKTNTV